MWVNSAIGSYYKWDQRFHHVRQRRHAIWVSTQEDRLQAKDSQPDSCCADGGACLIDPNREEDTGCRNSERPRFWPLRARYAP